MRHHRTLAAGVAAAVFAASAAFLLSGLLTSHAVQNPRISLDMVTTGNTYDDTTNTMTLGPINSCLTSAANPATPHPPDASRHPGRRGPRRLSGPPQLHRRQDAAEHLQPDTLHRQQHRPVRRLRQPADRPDEPHPPHRHSRAVDTGRSTRRHEHAPDGARRRHLHRHAGLPGLAGHAAQGRSRRRLLRRPNRRRSRLAHPPGARQRERPAVALHEPRRQQPEPARQRCCGLHRQRDDDHKPHSNQLGDGFHGEGPTCVPLDCTSQECPGPGTPNPNDCRSWTPGPTATSTPFPTPPWMPQSFHLLCQTENQVMSDLHINVGSGVSRPSNQNPVTQNPAGCPAPSYVYGPPFPPAYGSIDIDWGTTCVDPGDYVRLMFQANCTTPEPGCGPPNVSCYHWTILGSPINPCPTPTSTPCPGCTPTPTATATATATARGPRRLPRQQRLRRRLAPAVHRPQHRQ